MKIQNKQTGFLRWYEQNLHDLFMGYANYVEAMKDSPQIDEMENVNEWLNEEWRLYKELRDK